MKIESPKESDVVFYSQFPSYKLVNKGWFDEYIYISSSDIKCKLEITELQKKYFQYAERSEYKGCGIELSFSEFKDMLNENCKYCGDLAGTIDRIDSNGCYSKDNVQPLCRKCNFMKYTYSEEEFKEHIKKVYTFLFIK